MSKKENQEGKKDPRTRNPDIHLNKGVEIMISSNREEEEPEEKPSVFSFKQTVTLFSRRFTVLFEIDKIDE
jgi:hypothetical protein